VGFIVSRAKRHGVALALPQAWGERFLFGLAVLAFVWLGLCLVTPMLAEPV